MTTGESTIIYRQNFNTNREHLVLVGKIKLLVIQDNNEYGLSDVRIPDS